MGERGDFQQHLDADNGGCTGQGQAERNECNSDNDVEGAGEGRKGAAGHNNSPFGVPTGGSERLVRLDIHKIRLI